MEETYAQHATAAPTAETKTTNALAEVHKLKLKHQHTMATMQHLKNGNTNSQHTWVYKTQHIHYSWIEQRMRQTVLAESDLRTAAGSTQEAESWIQLSTNLKHILVTTTSGPAATAVRQHQQDIGLEVYNYAFGSQHHWEQGALVT